MLKWFGLITSGLVVTVGLAWAPTAASGCELDCGPNDPVVAAADKLPQPVRDDAVHAYASATGIFNAAYSDATGLSSAAQQALAQQLQSAQQAILNLEGTAGAALASASNTASTALANVQRAEGTATGEIIDSVNDEVSAISQEPSAAQTDVENASQDLAGLQAAVQDAAQTSSLQSSQPPSPSVGAGCAPSTDLPAPPVPGGTQAGNALTAANATAADSAVAVFNAGAIAVNGASVPYDPISQALQDAIGEDSSNHSGDLGGDSPDPCVVTTPPTASASASPSASANATGADTYVCRFEGESNGVGGFRPYPPSLGVGSYNDQKHLFDTYVRGSATFNCDNDKYKNKIVEFRVNLMKLTVTNYGAIQFRSIAHNDVAFSTARGQLFSGTGAARDCTGGSATRTYRLGARITVLSGPPNITPIRTSARNSREATIPCRAG